MRCSVPVVQNLLSNAQAMNMAFGPWRFVNTYGAFGTVTKRRFEVELQGTRDAYPTDDAAWLAYEFAAKPGDPQRAPRWLAPYHLRNDSPPSPNARCPPTLEPCSVACDLPRLPPDALVALCAVSQLHLRPHQSPSSRVHPSGLDWLMWFLPFKSWRRHEWLLPLVAKLCANDPPTSALLARDGGNPFLDGEPPQWVRGVLWEYSYAPRDADGGDEGAFWERRFVREWMPPQAA